MTTEIEIEDEEDQEWPRLLSATDLATMAAKDIKALGPDATLVQIQALVAKAMGINSTSSSLATASLGNVLNESDDGN